MTSLTALDKDSFRHVASFLDESSLMRLARSSESGRSIVEGNERDWQARAARKGIKLAEGIAAYPQVRNWNRLDSRLVRAYEEGVRSGPKLACTLARLNMVGDESEPFKTFRSCLGLFTLCPGVFCLVVRLQISGVVLTSAGTLLILQGFTSRQFVIDTCGDAKGRWNMHLVKTSACARRALRSSFCERVSSNMSYLKNAVFNVFNRIVGR